MDKEEPTIGSLFGPGGNFLGLVVDLIKRWRTSPKKTKARTGNVAISRSIVD